VNDTAWSDYLQTKKDRERHTVPTPVREIRRPESTSGAAAGEVFAAGGRQARALENSGAYEFGKRYGAPNESGFPNDFAAGVLAETVVGPVFLGGSIGDTGHDKWFFQLGHLF
jgi:hypothetical protein